MMLKNKKSISQSQEEFICNFLSSRNKWHRVSGSGSRPGFPGDVESDSWLGECKTHVVVSDILIFEKRVWDKIKSEALSRFKYPVLFVDTGYLNQDSDHTWCMFPNYIDVVVDDIVNVSKKYNKSVRVSKFDLLNFLENSTASINSVVFSVNLGTENVYICNLAYFQEKVTAV